MAWRRPQSHLRQVRHMTPIIASWEDLTESGTSAWYARRAQLRAAVFDTHEHRHWAPRQHRAASVLTGVIAEVRDDMIVLDGRHGKENVAISPATVTWLGTRAAPSVLRCGDPVILRHRASTANPRAQRLAERVWARIGRVTGAIVAVGENGREFLVDAGRHDRSPQRVVIAAAAQRQIQVRFPRLSPGYLIDVIGTRHADYLLAVVPATAQPPYHAGHSPAPPLVSGPVPVPVSGTAVWHEPDDEPPDLLGLGYPALDPDSDDRPADGGTGCARLPLLSLGSFVRVRNECADRDAVLPVTRDGAMARQFCDRCVECGTSPKGRVADLTMAAFAELGGNLEDGCFNATLTLAG
jgi:hypothetical protein